MIPWHSCPPPETHGISVEGACFPAGEVVFLSWSVLRLFQFYNSPGYGTMITQCACVRHPPAGITFEKAAVDEREVYHRTGYTSNEGWLLPVIEQCKIQV